jgi:hypothetical protein
MESEQAEMKETRARLAKQHAGYMDLLKSVARDREQLDADLEAIKAEKASTLPPDKAKARVRELEAALSAANLKALDLVESKKALQRERDEARSETARARATADRVLASAIHGPPPKVPASKPVPPFDQPPPVPPSAAPAPPRPKAPDPEDAAFGFLAKFPRQKVDSVFGKIAIEQRMVTHEQVAECLEIQSFMEPPIPLIGVLLMRKGYMKRPDVYRVLEMAGKRLGG